MTVTNRFFAKSALPFAAISVALVLIGCGSTYRASPEQVEASNPTVTYKYRNDQELIEANQQSMAFCNRYQSVPRTERFDTDSDGARVVYFECVASPTSTALPAQYVPNATFTYRTDQELLDISRKTQAYCLDKGSQQTFSNIVNNADGTRTVTFQCTSP